MSSSCTKRVAGKSGGEQVTAFLSFQATLLVAAAVVPEVGESSNNGSLGSVKRVTS